MKWRALIAILAVLTLSAFTHESSGKSKFITYAGSDLKLIPGEYLVAFDSKKVSAATVSERAHSLVAGTRGRVTYVFTVAFRGFSVTHLDDAWARDVSSRSDVEFVRKNFRIHASELRGGIYSPVPWNLDRIDQRAPFSLDRDYRFKTGPVGKGKPVPIYILDNGVYKAHDEFATAAGGSRVTDVADVTPTATTAPFARCTAPWSDANHGTEVASIAAGKTLGITPTRIMNVKVLSPALFTCAGGSPSQVAAGLEETLKHMQSHKITRAVVNLSVGWDVNAPDVRTEVAKVQRQGAIVVAAAGNENRNAAATQPANLPGVLAVGATTDTDARLVASMTIGSNYGSTVALWAPGFNIKAADWTDPPSPAATSSGSGTSEAAPQVAGAAALVWQQHPKWSASQVTKNLRSRATRNMLSDLRPGSTNALLYIGEDAPALKSRHQISRSGQDGELRAVRVAYDEKSVYVAGGDSFGAAASGPYAYAAYRVPTVATGPVWQVTHATGLPPATALPAGTNADCIDIHASNTTTFEGVSNPVYFGCMGTHNGAREAMVIATRQDGTPIWPPVWLGPGSQMGGVTGNDRTAQFGVFAITTRPKPAPAVGSDVVITSLRSNGTQAGSVVLTAPGFTEQFHSAVDLVLVETRDPSSGTTSADLIAATNSDPPGPDKTFLWRLDPDTLTILGHSEVPVPSLAANGMFATALAVQPLETNANIQVPGEVFLATTVAVTDRGRTALWGYVYRLKPDHLGVNNIEVVKDANITSLWSSDGDLYIAGMTTRTFPPGDLYGVEKPGANPDYDAFLGKTEGIYNSRRWMVTYDTPGHLPNSGYGGSGAKRGYLVGSDTNGFYVLEYLVY